MTIARKHLEQDMFNLMRAIGEGQYTTGIRRVSKWINIQEKHIRFWMENRQRIPEHWVDEIQRCCEHYSGSRVPLRIENDQRAVRSCLRCRIKFPSEGIGNRICEKCKSSEEFKSAKMGIIETWTLPQ